MGTNTGNKPRTKGAFVVGFITAVSEISDAFGNQMENVLAENGIEDPTVDETYPMDSVVSSINQMADEVGPSTTNKIGVHQVTIPEWPDEIDSVEKGFAALSDAYRDAYVNFSEDHLGQFLFEKTGSGEGRAAVSEEYPYPAAFARGIFEGVLKEFGSSHALTSISETDAENDEKAAYEIHW